MKCNLSANYYYVQRIHTNKNNTHTNKTLRPPKAKGCLAEGHTLIIIKQKPGGWHWSLDCHSNTFPSHILQRSCKELLCDFEAPGSSGITSELHKPHEVSLTIPKKTKVNWKSTVGLTANNWNSSQLNVERKRPRRAQFCREEKWKVKSESFADVDAAPGGLSSGRKEKPQLWGLPHFNSSVYSGSPLDSTRCVFNEYSRGLARLKGCADHKVSTLQKSPSQQPKFS